MASRRRRIVVVGSGTRFLSGISVYTVRLANALASLGHGVSIVTMRQLLPTRLYPGRSRVGADLAQLVRDPRVSMFDGIDWFWLPSLFKAAAFISRRRPEIIILQWWSGTVLHSYLALCLLARLMRARVVIEFHEVLDTGEARIPLARIYASVVGQAVIRLAAGYTVHSEFDRALLRTHWRLGDRPVQVLPHGPHDHYQESGTAPRMAALREAPEGVCNVLFFGVIRPYKGLEDLVDAFGLIPESEIDGYWLTIVGETWEGFTLPAVKIEGSRYRDRITFVNRYVPDAELGAWLDGADAVALPYLRSSLSGPLHVAMGYGLPIVMTNVGGNAEAAAGYEGIRLVPARDPASLLGAIRGMPALRGLRFAHPHSWAQTAEAYEALFAEILPGDAAAGLSDIDVLPTRRDTSNHKVA
jgi:glycosyltransferase involved in cell wall biosynthesis